MPKKKSESKVFVGTNIPPQLIDYKVSMTIRTGEYSNIVVDFHFEEGTMEDAVMTIDKYVDEMYTKYYNFLERPKTVPVVPVVPAAPATIAPVAAPKKELPKSSFEKAQSMINAAKTIDALTDIENRIKLSLQLRYRDWETDRKSTRLNSSHITRSRMPSSA